MQNDIENKCINIYINRFSSTGFGITPSRCQDRIITESLLLQTMKPGLSNTLMAATLFNHNQYLLQ